jgi:hypothetical protein
MLTPNWNYNPMIAFHFKRMCNFHLDLFCNLVAFEEYINKNPIKSPFDFFLKLSNKSPNLYIKFVFNELLTWIILWLIFSHHTLLHWGWWLISSLNILIDLSHKDIYNLQRILWRCKSTLKIEKNWIFFQGILLIV